MPDMALAILHHLLVFGLAIMLAMELAYLRVDPVPVTRLSRLDAGYGAVAVLILIVGVARVVWGAKGWVAYSSNPFFWGKIATFTAIGLISIVPTLQFMRGSKALKADAGFRPDPRRSGPHRAMGSCGGPASAAAGRLRSRHGPCLTKSSLVEGYG